MSPTEVVGIIAAGLAAGGVNAVVGSGSLITFPTLLAFGYSPVVANVTNTVGIVGGSISSVIGYRRELADQVGRCIRYGAAAALGALLGGLLLLKLPGSVFEAVVPLLILLACVLIALQPRIAKRLASVRAHHLGIAGYVAVFLTGVYGGYFGAAQGVILIALLSLLIDDGLQRLNGLKNVLAGIANIVAALLFILVADIAWAAAGLVAIGSIVGAYLGARYGRRIPPHVLRWIIIVVGTIVAVILFFT